MREEVLVVDDEPQMLIAVNETLRRSGYAVTTAGSGMEALNRLREKFFSLVVTDMRMPEVSGMDLLRRIKNLAPQVPVVLLTAYGTVQNAVDAMREGAYDYLLKPFSAEALEDVVRRALDSGEPGKGRAPHTIITQDAEFARTIELATHAAGSAATILIEAESGTGKELLARMIHDRSPRRNGPFVAVNCAALPENLLESELFGFEKGAFTGAGTSKAGKFELAEGGTLLLDEIGEMAPILQAKLLRVLQEKEVDRIGGRAPVPINVRVIATTNRDLHELSLRGEFRQDLYYRLNVVRLGIPPLRERSGDIPLLTDFFCKRYGRSGREDLEVSPEAAALLCNHPWPGNVRELENAIQRAATLCQGAVIEPGDLFLSAPGDAVTPQPGAGSEADGGELGISAGLTMREMEKRLIRQTLASTGGNRTHAARSLGISLRTLRNKLNEFGLQDRSANSAQAMASF
ncbi:MAG: sigma-54 dependent transcriptional regulator [Acidobacteriota bacterium]|jgi:two-component system response regulator FlrC|nr:sigma-54 dependent transcriptional regulator [Acidobacteriota bacterium]